MSGGYLKYLEHMLPLLRDDPGVASLDVFMPSGVQWVTPAGFVTHTWPVADARQGYRHLRTQLHRLAPDVVFIPTARWLDCGRIPTVVMVRNMEPLTVPFGGNSWQEGIKNLARAFAARMACQRATRAIAVSQHVRDFLINQWKISHHKIGLVYHGIEVSPSREHAVKPQTLAGYEFERFIFTAGSIRPARGLEDLIRAMAILPVHEPALTLVIGGKPDPGTQFHMRQMQRLAKGLGVASRVVWAGQLNSLEMSWCFYRCAAFLVTSRAEACPNIALEAMSHGCAIVSTNQPPMPEFFVESAWYYTRRDARDLAEKIALALDGSREQREARQAAARSRAHDFNWPDTARRTFEQLRLAVEASRVVPREEGPG
jgi:glycosyltransferase involved in cell wall biosynthesis